MILIEPGVDWKNREHLCLHRPPVKPASAFKFNSEDVGIVLYLQECEDNAASLWTVVNTLSKRRHGNDSRSAREFRKTMFLSRVGKLISNGIIQRRGKNRLRLSNLERIKPLLDASLLSTTLPEPFLG